jgi:hypothetical protein
MKLQTQGLGHSHENRNSMVITTPILEKNNGEVDAHAHGHDAHGGHGHGGIDINDPNRPKYGLKERLHHFTWAWYVFPMSTGGLSLLLFAQPFQFPGLRGIGMFVYVLNLIIFALVTMTMLARFFLYPGDFKASVTHPREGFFVPTFFLTIATVITSTQRYALQTTDVTSTWAIQVAFWGYVIFALMLAVGQYSYVFAAHSFGLHTMVRFPSSTHYSFF